jgi:hypothetical protein
MKDFRVYMTFYNEFFYKVGLCKIFIQDLVLIDMWLHPHIQLPDNHHAFSVLIVLHSQGI